MITYKQIIAKRFANRADRKRATFPEILMVSQDILDTLKKEVSAPFYTNGTIHNFAGNYCLVIENEENFYEWFYIEDLENGQHEQSILSTYHIHRSSKTDAQTSLSTG